MTSITEHRVECPLPTIHGNFQLHLFLESLEDGQKKEHIALVMGNIRGATDVLMRMHSECCTGDIFGCQRCDCQDQLNTSLDMIRRKGEGILLYLRQEGRGIGLENKLRAYNLQDQGMDTVDANLHLGFAPDARQYDIAVEIANYFEIKSVSLISNNPSKVDGLAESGVNVSGQIPIVINSIIRDRTDLFRVKQRKLGHMFGHLEGEIIFDEEADYPLSCPGLFFKNAPIPEISIENTEVIRKELISRFGDNLSCILFQGSNMRGDGSIHESDFDYICIFRHLSPHIIREFAHVKKERPRSNFLYLSEDEYRMYPQDARLQFFITRRVHGDFDLGSLPGRTDILRTALKYAIQLKDTIRPLLLELVGSPKDKSLVSQAHTTLKRVDDCFMRVVCLYVKGKYPLHREHLKDITQAQSVHQIVGVIERWYSGLVTTEEICDTLRTAERLITIFIRATQKNLI